nr:MAG TPA: hypothetical protein [Caudoviricetes sp.]
MSEQDYEQLTLFPEDSHASPSPWLESKREKGMIDTYGRRCSELSPSCARVALSVRTFLESSRLPPGRWSRIWSVLAITSSCLILRLRLSERGTDDQEYSSSESQMWPTPTTVGCTIASEKRINLIADGKTTFASNQGERGGLSNLREHVLARTKGLWTTPCAADAQGSHGGNNHRSLRTDVAGQLNPMWVEWLMGFPQGWTDLNVSETR